MSNADEIRKQIQQLEYQTTTQRILVSEAYNGYEFDLDYCIKMIENFLL